MFSNPNGHWYQAVLCTPSLHHSYLTHITGKCHMSLSKCNFFQNIGSTQILLLRGWNLYNHVIITSVKAQLIFKYILKTISYSNGQSIKILRTIRCRDASLYQSWYFCICECVYMREQNKVVEMLLPAGFIIMKPKSIYFNVTEKWLDTQALCLLQVTMFPQEAGWNMHGGIQTTDDRNAWLDAQKNKTPHLNTGRRQCT